MWCFVILEVEYVYKTKSFMRNYYILRAKNGVSLVELLQTYGTYSVGWAFVSWAGTLVNLLHRIEMDS